MLPPVTSYSLWLQRGKQYKLYVWFLFEKQFTIEFPLQLQVNTQTSSFVFRRRGHKSRSVIQYFKTTILSLTMKRNFGFERNNRNTSVTNILTISLPVVLYGCETWSQTEGV
jgi:hypothetical protein